MAQEFIKKSISSIVQKEWQKFLAYQYFNDVKLDNSIYSEVLHFFSALL
jgi:hypothetical protein